MREPPTRNRTMPDVKRPTPQTAGRSRKLLDDVAVLAVFDVIMTLAPSLERNNSIATSSSDWLRENLYLARSLPLMTIFRPLTDILCNSAQEISFIGKSLKNDPDLASRFSLSVALAVFSIRRRMRSTASPAINANPAPSSTTAMPPSAKSPRRVGTEYATLSSPRPSMTYEVDPRRPITTAADPDELPSFMKIARGPDSEGGGRISCRRGRRCVLVVYVLMGLHLLSPRLAGLAWRGIYGFSSY
jgi:hypothetical protein